ncbi:DUF6764 family protein [Nocardia sp. CS682]|uniref:DUF6764 family protein n=1 Tax=Nocardia sp. CS682 TaxID=1047172 RepID=UPI0010755634|nr:DUF6764 family protein [Nocardia sp. CS682]QBS46025.1 hypothetical protein DMB37_20855 [Nocardia sp. CS682]
MKLISMIVCSAAAVLTSPVWPAVASATDVHCTSENGADITVIDGHTACRAASDLLGQAKSLGIDGVGYANATLGARAIGIGMAGGVGASDGAGGIPIALGIGQDAIARSSIDSAGNADSAGDSRPAGAPLIAASVALDGSRAAVQTAENTVVCLGTGAFAWNSHTGDTCLSTPFGRWQTPVHQLP